MKLQSIEAFLKLQPQLRSSYNEISLLSKKKPNDVINKFKLKFINAILKNINRLLGEVYMPFPNDFTQFDEDELPNNGDVVYMLSHYLTSLEELRCDNIILNSFDWVWIVDDNDEAFIKTYPKPL